MIMNIKYVGIFSLMTPDDLILFISTVSMIGEKIYSHAHREISLFFFFKVHHGKTPPTHVLKSFSSWGFHIQMQGRSVYVMLIQHDTCLHKNVPASECTRRTPNTPAPPLGLLPSARLLQANYNRQSLLSPHSFFLYPAAPLCPCPMPPTLLTARLATARRNELSCI